MTEPQITQAIQTAMQPMEARLTTRLERLDAAIYGNGSSGIRARIVKLETKQTYSARQNVRAWDVCKLLIAAVLSAAVTVWVTTQMGGG